MMLWLNQLQINILMSEKFSQLNEINKKTKFIDLMNPNIIIHVLKTL